MLGKKRDWSRRCSRFLCIGIDKIGYAVQRKRRIDYFRCWTTMYYAKVINQFVILLTNGMKQFVGLLASHIPCLFSLLAVAGSNL